jgi:alpha-L-rhamnosidase
MNDTPIAVNAEPCWIWIGDQADDANAFILFRREFAATPGTPLQLLISAETRYRAFINGQRLGDGPPPSMYKLMYCDSCDLGPFLRAGRNTLAVVVHQCRNVNLGRGGFWATLVNSDSVSFIVTDTTWRCRRAPQWRQKMHASHLNGFDPYQEAFDSRQEPPGWMNAGFNDTDWPAAVAVPNPPWARPIPRDIPMMLETPLRPARIDRIEECIWLENRGRPEDLSICLSQVGLPVQFARVENPQGLLDGRTAAAVQCSANHLKDPTFDGVYDPCLLLDFGRVITGTIELDVEGPEGAGIDLGMAERLIDGQFNNAIEGQFAARYTLKAGRQTWRTFTWRGFRYLKLRVRECFEPMCLHAVRAIETTYPYEERGAFHSTDEQLNRVFEISRRTLRLCSHESFVDTPWREQSQWLGDVSAVTIPAVYACFGDTALAEKFLRQSAATRRPDGLLQNVTNRSGTPGAWVISDYSFWWIMAAWHHYLYTGRRDYLETLYLAVLSIVDACAARLNSRGLLGPLQGWIVYVEWADVDKRGECAAYNALFAGALDAAAEIAAALGHNAEAARFGGLAAGVRAGFTDRFFDEARGVFADANLDGRLSDKASEHGNMAAIAFGLCDEARAASIIRRIYEDHSVKVTEAQPFFTSVVLRALDKAGRFDLALQLIRERWGRRMLDRGATSTFEEWGINGSWRAGQYKGFMRTLSHAWSASPAEFLIRNLAGIRILEPGCRKVAVTPRPVDFDYDLTYPTPLGPIRVTRAQGETVIACAPGIAV